MIVDSGRALEIIELHVIVNACLLQKLALPVINHVVKHLHVGLPRALVVLAPPLTDRALVGQPHNSVDVAGIAHVDSILVESRRNLLAVF